MNCYNVVLVLEPAAAVVGGGQAMLPGALLSGETLLQTSRALPHRRHWESGAAQPSSLQVLHRHICAWAGSSRTRLAAKSHLGCRLLALFVGGLFWSGVYFDMWLFILWLLVEMYSVQIYEFWFCCCSVVDFFQFCFLLYSCVVKWAILDCVVMFHVY